MSLASYVVKMYLDYIRQTAWMQCRFLGSPEISADKQKGGCLGQPPWSNRLRSGRILPPGYSLSLSYNLHLGRGFHLGMEQGKVIL